MGSILPAAYQSAGALAGDPPPLTLMHEVSTLSDDAENTDDTHLPDGTVDFNTTEVSAGRGNVDNGAVILIKAVRYVTDPLLISGGLLP